MYKTIRHGENSLQYTILPQNDDFRIEGKLTSVSSNGNNSSKSKSKRSTRRRSFFAYLGLLFVCTVIIGAVLVPFLVSAECLPNPSDWFLKTKAALSGTMSTRRLATMSTSSFTTTVSAVEPTTISTDIKSNKKLIESTIQSYPVDRSSITAPQISDPQVVVTFGAEKPPSTDGINTHNNDDKSNQTLAGSKATNDFIAEVRFERLRGQTPATIVPTIIVTTVKTSMFEVPNLTTPTTTTMSTMTSRIQSIGLIGGGQNLTNRIMQVPLLKSASKKPIIPPVLAKTNSLERPNTKGPDDRNHQVEIPGKGKENPDSANDWIRSHWPYIDPSTYFQWTGYKTEDSVLLPAILGIALIVIIIIIALCLVARNKRSIVNSVRKRNRNDIEATGEDNTTLLTNSNLSDED